MRTICLDEMGVQQMTTDELAEIDGGFWPIILAAALVGGLMLISTKAH